MSKESLEARSGFTPFLQFHQTLGFWGVPHWERDMLFPTYTGDTPIRVSHNSRGCRDIEQSGTGGVLCFGGSHTWGAGVEQDACHTAVLRRHTEKNVYNAGHCSLGLDQISLAAILMADDYKPDVIVIEQYPWALHRVINKTVAGFVRPSFYLDKKGDLQLSKVPLSARWNLTRNLMDSYHTYKKGLAEFKYGIQLGGKSSFNVDPFYLHWKIGYYSAMYDLIDKILAQLSDFCKQRGILLLFGLSAVNEQYQKSASPLIDYTLPRNKFIQLLAANNIEWTDISEKLVAEQSEDDPCCFYDGHLNEKGHRIFGESVAQALKERGAL